MSLVTTGTAKFLSNKNRFCFLADNDAPWKWTCMGPRNTVGRFDKEEQYILLYIKYESSGPCGFGEEYIFPL